MKTYEESNPSDPSKCDGCPSAVDSWCPGCGRCRCNTPRGRPICTRCCGWRGGSEPIPADARFRMMLRVAVLRNAGPLLVACSLKRPGAPSGIWPCEVIQWRRTRALVRVRCGAGTDVRLVPVDRLQSARERQEAISRRRREAPA